MENAIILVVGLVGFIGSIFFWAFGKSEKLAMSLTAGFAVMAISALAHCWIASWFWAVIAAIAGMVVFTYVIAGYLKIERKVKLIFSDKVLLT